jgi:hypothetical protein
MYALCGVVGADEVDGSCNVEYLKITNVSRRTEQFPRAIAPEQCTDKHSLASRAYLVYYCSCFGETDAVVDGSPTF